MHLKIKHHTEYKYEQSVFPEPHHLYFTPLKRSYLETESFKLNISPNAVGIAQRLDLENNHYHQCWFEDQTQQLIFDIEMTVSLAHFNQFNFLVEQESKTIHQKVLQLYIEDRVVLNDQLLGWLNKIDDQDSITFIGKLCEKIHSKWEHSTNYTPELLDPNICFQETAASCRDLAWLMIQLLRHKNYAARFVSGYSHNPELEGHELHAWVEVWVPGPGWVSVDPSSGLFTTEYYIPVAASYHPANTLPVQGSYRGAAFSELNTTVEIKLI